MRPSFHHQPEAQHPNFQLSTSWTDQPQLSDHRGRSACTLATPMALIRPLASGHANGTAGIAESGIEQTVV